MMEATSAGEAFALERNLWLILVHHPDEEGETVLQGEGPDGTYILGFTSENKAHSALRSLGIERRCRTLCVPHGFKVELLTAMCQVGACGLMLDLEPDARRYLRTCRLVAAT